MLCPPKIGLIYFAIDQVKERVRKLSEGMMKGMDRINSTAARFQVNCRGLDWQSHILRTLGLFGFGFV